MIWRWFQSRAEGPADKLYQGLVQAARRPQFYADWFVPDTVDGRFEMISVHMFLALDRIRQIGPTAETLGQDLADIFFKDMDRSLREMGVGDLSVGKKVRKMAEAFYGRATAYSAAMDTEGTGLEDALRRNVFAGAGDGDTKALSAWVKQAREALRNHADERILAGQIEWP